jgi:hypothetical protein
MGGVPADEFFQGHFLVPAFAQKAVDGLVFGKGAISLADVKFFTAMPQGGQDIVAVHDREVSAVAPRLKQAEHGIGIGMKGAALYRSQARMGGIAFGPPFGKSGHALLPHEQSCALQHFLRRLAGEGEQKNGGRGHARLHQPGQTVDNGARFAAARPGNDQNRPRQSGGGFILRRIEIALVVDHTR